ncbi:MAG: hypothetical protein ACI87O_000170 [Planctomycetota bacterium]|jgi:hypothetical protein
MLRPTILLLGLCIPAFSQGPVFQPKIGTTWTRSHDLEMHVKFDRISMEVNGQASDDTDFDIEVVSSNHLLVEDVILEWHPEGPRHLERTYLEVERERTAPIKMTVNEATVSSKIQAHGESPMLGERVNFRSEARGQSWLPTFAEGSAENLPSEWLTSLETNLDYSLLLPRKRSKAGARWNVDPKAFLMALDTGHSMPFDFGADRGDDLPLWIGGVAEQPELSNLWDSFETSRVRCTLMPQRKAGHLRLLEIQVTATFHGDADLSDWAMESITRQGQGGEGLNVNSASQSTVLTGSGVYLWDLDRRAMHSFHFRATAQFVRQQDVTAMTGDEEMHIALNTEGHFDLKVNAKLEK